MCCSTGLTYSKFVKILAGAFKRMTGVTVCTAFVFHLCAAHCANCRDVRIQSCSNRLTEHCHYMLYVGVVGQFSQMKLCYKILTSDS